MAVGNNQLTKFLKISQLALVSQLAAAHICLLRTEEELGPRGAAGGSATPTLPARGSHRAQRSGAPNSKPAPREGRESRALCIPADGCRSHVRWGKGNTLARRGSSGVSGMLLQRTTKETDCGNVLEGQQPEHRSGGRGGP